MGDSLLAENLQFFESFRSSWAGAPTFGCFGASFFLIQSHNQIYVCDTAIELHSRDPELALVSNQHLNTLHFLSFFSSDVSLSLIQDLIWRNNVIYLHTNRMFCWCCKIYKFFLGTELLMQVVVDKCFQSFSFLVA